MADHVCEECEGTGSCWRCEGRGFDDVGTPGHPMPLRCRACRPPGQCAACGGTGRTDDDCDDSPGKAAVA